MKKTAFHFRPSTLNERREFYEKEFSIEKAKEWFKKNKMPLPQLCAIDSGTETNIIKNKKWKGKLFYFLFSELKEKIKKYCPEDVYYDRNIYKDPKKILKTLKFNNPIKQELVFDIDSDNIFCNNHEKEKICNLCLDKAFIYASKMKRELARKFKKIKIIYSGRGFHLHVLDKKAYELEIAQRKKISEKFVSIYPIDPGVSNGLISLIRMPFSLNTLVSRKAVPLSNKDKFDKTSTIPRFLRK